MIFSAGQITLTANPQLDFYKASEFYITVGIEDDLFKLNDTDGENVLTINLEMKNQAPYFDPSTYTLNIAEGCSDDVSDITVQHWR